MKEKIRDPQIRSVLRSHVAHLYPDRIIDELGISSIEGRVDVVTVTRDAIHGYEIKSDVDKLDRLPGEAERYGRVLDFLTLVTTKKHMPSARKMVPGYWGLILFTEKRTLKVLREAKPNPKRSHESMSCSLWRPEALSLLKKVGADKGVTSKPKYILHARVASACSQEQVHAALVSQYLRHDAFFRESKQKPQGLELSPVFCSDL